MHLNVDRDIIEWAKKKGRREGDSQMIINREEKIFVVIEQKINLRIPYEWNRRNRYFIPKQILNLMQHNMKRWSTIIKGPSFYYSIKSVFLEIKFLMTIIWNERIFIKEFSSMAQMLNFFFVYIIYIHRYLQVGLLYEIVENCSIFEFSYFNLWPIQRSIKLM